MNEFQRRIGVGERSRIGLKHQGGTKTTQVVREEGSTRGSVAGTTTEHWDGRRDSTVLAPTVKIIASRSERKIVSATY